jgi:hypothetical protein
MTRIGGSRPNTVRRRAVKRFFIVLSISLLAALGLNTGIASAGQPANQACVGESLSALASNQEDPGTFGQVTRGFAQLPGPHGANIQAFQAGVVDDDIVPNTCND